MLCLLTWYVHAEIHAIVHLILIKGIDFLPVLVQPRLTGRSGRHALQDPDSCLITWPVTSSDDR
jgi:hypothetical protein